MHLSQHCCRRVTPLTLYGLALSLAVALWGACYKVEQYPQQGRAFRVMAPAKLLTEKERPRHASALHWAPTSAKSQGAPLRHLPAIFAGDYHPALQALLIQRTRRHNFVYPELTFFSFRPPPPRFAF